MLFRIIKAEALPHERYVSEYCSLSTKLHHLKS